MDFLRLRFYIEILAIATGFVLLVCVLPIQIFIDGEIRLLTVLCGTLLWFTIIRYNETFHFLLEKWFKR
jgi:hypothetical protein